MTDAITRCPKCHTSFKLNQEHLNSARGAVRCGSCLTIFNAKEHLLKPPPKPVPGALTKTQNHKPLEPEPDEDILISDDMDAKAGISHDEGFDENVFITHNSGKTEINLFERKPKNLDDDRLRDTDESWALKLLDDDGLEEKRLRRKKKKTPEKQPITDQPTFRFVDDTPQPEPHEKPPRQNEPPPPDIAVEQTNGAEEEVPFEEVPFEEIPFEQEVGDDNYKQNHLDSFSAFEPEPLELEVTTRRPMLKSSFFWLVMSLLALITAGIQLAIYNFNDWGLRENLRPYYTQACSILGCTLPARHQPDLIKIESMVVLNHPQNKNKLLVDATLINRASFEQPFPKLHLSFTNLQNQRVDEFYFSPSEYVGGELAGKSQMPSLHPIHIALEIADPGEDAINYQISIVKP